MRKSISNGLEHARIHTKLNTSILVVDTCLGTRLRLCLASSSRADYLSLGPVRAVTPRQPWREPAADANPPWTKGVNQA